MIILLKDLTQYPKANLELWHEEERAISNLIKAAYDMHLNYVFVDKGLVTEDCLKVLKECGYKITIGYGEVARIKISWPDTHD